MKKKLLACILMVGIVSSTLTGCFESWENDQALKGGIVFTEKSSYVILNKSGGHIMDCYILDDTFVESENISDGIRFKDSKGTGIIIQGDAKIVRMSGADERKNYVEYHIEKDLIPYEEFYKLHAKGN